MDSPILTKSLFYELRIVRSLISYRVFIFIQIHFVGNMFSIHLFRVGTKLVNAYIGKRITFKVCVLYCWCMYEFDARIDHTTIGIARLRYIHVYPQRLDFITWHHGDITCISCHWLNTLVPVSFWNCNTT